MLNMTQHPATPEQVTAGVTDLPAESRQRLCELLTFEALPSREEVRERAAAIAKLALAAGAEEAMIGGAPFLMPPLEAALNELDVPVWYAFSRRESVEQTMPNGDVRKTAVFRHAGFVRGGWLARHAG